MWYGNEVIAHHDTLVQGEVDFNTCVTIHLRDVTHEVRHINLIQIVINYKFYRLTLIFYNNIGDFVIDK